MNDTEQSSSEFSSPSDGLKSKAAAYDHFAPYYDHYMRHVDYERWTQKFLSLYELHTHNKPKDILELACGTANIAERLVGLGFNVTATDRSAEMLRIAAQKSDKLELIQADMTEPVRTSTFDLIILAFDSINYLLQDEQVSSLYINSAKALREKGLFIFDISTYKNSMDNFNGYLNLDGTNDYTLIHQADFDTEKRLQKTKITVFQLQDGLYHKLEEEHCQRVYFVQELLRLFDGTPLACLGVYSMVYDKNLLNTNSRRLDHQYSRLFFVCRRRNGEGR